MPMRPARTPVPKELSPMVKVLAIVVVVAFVVFYIMTSPDQAANIAGGFGHWVSDVAHGIGRFLDKLSS
jgi:hypothetical protein